MPSEPHVLALIPARGGSKGIAGKNIRPLAGKPLIQYSCQCALGSELIHRTIVSTDCHRIANVARAAGVEVPFMRPAELAADDTPTLHVVQHTIRWLRSENAPLPDILVLLQPTAPLRQSHHIDEAVRRLLASDADSIVSVCRVPAHFHPDWQLAADGGQLRLYAGKPLKEVTARRQLLSPTYYRNGAIYAFRRQTVESTGSFYGDHCLAYEMPLELSINIDTMAEWEAAERLIAGKETAHEAA